MSQSIHGTIYVLLFLSFPVLLLYILQARTVPWTDQLGKWLSAPAFEEVHLIPAFEEVTHKQTLGLLCFLLACHYSVSLPNEWTSSSPCFSGTW